jgi:hypothetical protein
MTKLTSLNQTGRIRTAETCLWAINEFKKGYHPRTNSVKDERGNLLADPQKFWRSEIITSVSCWTYMEQVVLGRLKCIQPSHLCQAPVPQGLRLLLESWKVKNLQVLITFQPI